MKISIVIVNYNTSELLKACLNSLRNLEYDTDSEIVVVDNASNDDSVYMVEHIYPWVKIIRNKFNNGFSKANNQGIKAANGKYILLLNSDTVVINNCLRKVINFMDKEQSVGIVGCKILNADRTFHNSYFRFPNFFSELMIFTSGIIKYSWDPFTHHKFMKYSNCNAIKKIDSIGGCFLCIRKEVINMIGYLDENMFMYYEDIEYCKRVYKYSNYKIYYFPFAEIIHIGQGSSKMDNQRLQPYLNSFRSLRYYFRKYHGNSYEKAFIISCKIIWCLDILILNLLRWHPNTLNKIELIKKLYQNNKI